MFSRVEGDLVEFLGGEGAAVEDESDLRAGPAGFRREEVGEQQDGWPIEVDAGLLPALSYGGLERGRVAVLDVASRELPQLAAVGRPQCERVHLRVGEEQRRV